MASTEPRIAPDIITDPMKATMMLIAVSTSPWAGPSSNGGGGMSGPIRMKMK